MRLALLGALAFCLCGQPVWAGGDAKGKKDKDVELKVDGKLAEDDPIDKTFKRPHKMHELNAKKDVIYVIDLSSDAFDALLRLDSPKGKMIAVNDDANPPNLDAQIVFKAKEDGTFKIIAAALDNKAGAYKLTVRRGSEEDIAKSDPFFSMIGKPAPEITSVFSFNGETKKLSELKGNVVLVDFWAVWCGPCIATFPHLREWANDFKKEGLEIVGVTTYFESLGFDKDKGAVIKAPAKLSQAEEHDMLKAFVGHHKLGHRMITVSQDDWKSVGKDYKIRGIPHVALVDRKGIVRMVRVGSSPENAEALREEILKLVKEK